MFLPFNTDHFENRVDELNTLIQSNYDSIEALLTLEDKTYANFVRPFEMLDDTLERFFTPISHMNSVKNSELTQKIYSESLPILSEYGTNVGQDERIYEAYKAIKASEYNQLDATKQRILDQSILGFKLSGAELCEADKARLKEINLRKSELSNNFTQNLLDSTNAFELVIEDAKDVEGLPKSDIETAKEERDGKEVFVFTLQMPSYIAYMTYGPNREYREALYKAYTTRAPENAAIIDELLALKDEASKLLGFNSYAERSLATKMAPKVESVLGFLEDLKKASIPQGKRELEALQSFAHSEGLDALKSYDTAYYAEKLRKRDYDIDEEAYRPYFEQKSVVNGLFDFLGKLLGLRFEKSNETLWDDKATSYDVYDQDVLKARLYIDLEARKEKRGGAWMHNWQTHCENAQNETALASAFIVCNFPPSSDETPSLLRHDDVVTLFHEMGHALHHMLSNVTEFALSGVNGIEWDAVEFPSQFLENFAYAPQVLTLFAKHYESGEVLPQTMIEKLVKAKNFQSAMSMLRQLEFGLFDFKLHSKLHQGEEVQALLDSIRSEIDLLKPPSYNKFQNGFGHIFGGGYAAGYYSYKWAEVLSADAYFYFVDNGIFNEAIANDYKEVILGGGASASMEQLFERFRKQPLDTNALLRLSGISA